MPAATLTFGVSSTPACIGLTPKTLTMGTAATMGLTCPVQLYFAVSAALTAHLDTVSVRLQFGVNLGPLRVRSSGVNLATGRYRR